MTKGFDAFESRQTCMDSVEMKRSQQSRESGGRKQSYLLPAEKDSQEVEIDPEKDGVDSAA